MSRHHEAVAVVARRQRCAIYTRKSSENGLEQEFNSLDAQREACAAYIASQVSEGWRALSAQYDDAGISGGTMDRPGLQRLMADIKRVWQPSDSSASCKARPLITVASMPM